MIDWKSQYHENEKQKASITMCSFVQCTDSRGAVDGPILQVIRDQEAKRVVALAGLVLNGQDDIIKVRSTQTE